MDKTYMCVYAILLFISLFVIAKNVDALQCETDADCPQIPNLHPIVYRCLNNNCILDRGDLNDRV
uniref:Nodule-specific cysteine-rich peptide G01 n=1 Tax=Pisum sativum TaxID=3888 RepID=A0A7T8DV24_PEA|nr:nodule-specific cysteine-rich peptide G01 [Pisum sativum]